MRRAVWCMVGVLALGGAGAFPTFEGIAWGQGLNVGGDDLPVPTPGAPQVFLDARASSFSRDGKIQIFEGEVVAMSAGAIFAADRIEVDRNLGVVKASGGVVLMTKTQIFTGDKITYIMAGGDFELVNGHMTVNDEAETAKVRARILGVTEAEVRAEAATTARLAELDHAKESIRRELRVVTSEKGAQTGNGGAVEPPGPLVDRYAQILDQEAAIKALGNVGLKRLTPARRQAFERRRRYFDESVKQAAQAGISLGTADSRGYFRLDGELLGRTNGNDYRAIAAEWTPCRCSKDETPAWAFRSERVDAQVEGYADMRHAVLEVAGIPMLYLPYFKVPIKDRRQSGFLPPSSSTSAVGGSVVRQPVYFVLGPDQDSTVNIDWFEKRGMRLGAEYRLQQRSWSGWEIKGEFLRDRVWNDERGQRDVLGSYYGYGLDRARENYVREKGAGQRDATLATIAPGKDATRDRLAQSSFWTDHSELTLCLTGTPEERSACERGVHTQLASPANSWRGSYSWKGMTFLAPRLSFVASGQMVSDHRYIEDLYMADSFSEAYNAGRYAPTYYPVRTNVHADLKDSYLGLGSSFGDNVLTDQRFRGQQMPASVIMQSRTFSLFPALEHLIPVYGQAGLQHREIRQMADDDPDAAPWSGEGFLGDGRWTRAELNITSPIWNKGVIQVSHFTDLESRYIQHKGLATDQSSISSWRTGFTFNLPIDGKAELPESFQPDAVEIPGAKRYLHHVMNWSATVSARPSVVRRGPYGEGDKVGEPSPVYFAGDRKVFDPNDDSIVRESGMAEFQGVSFATTHAWHDVIDGWQLTPEARKKRDIGRPARESTLEMARRELKESLEKPSALEESLLVGTKRVRGDWQRVTLTDDIPLSADGTISYNILEEKRRREVVQANGDIERQAQMVSDPAARDALLATRTRDSDLPQPWSEAVLSSGLTAFGLGLSDTIFYNIYLRTARKAEIRLGLPPFLGTTVGTGYILERSVIPTGRELVFKRTRERFMDFSSVIIPHVTLVSELRRRTIDDVAVPEDYQTRFGVQYISTSDCWGMSFTRTKLYDKQERLATYVLTLNVIFMGQARALPNMATPAVRAVSPGYNPNAT